MPFRISGNRGSQRVGRVQSMSIGRSAAFQSAQTVNLSVARRQRRCHPQVRRSLGVSLRRTRSILALFNPDQKTALCDSHHPKKQQVVTTITLRKAVGAHWWEGDNF